LGFLFLVPQLGLSGLSLFMGSTRPTLNHLTEHLKQAPYNAGHMCGIVSYNCQSLLRPQRINEILHSLRFNSVVALQGLKSRIVGKQPIAEYLISGFWVFIAGYNGSSNKHAGVALAFNTNHFPRSCIAGISWPTEACLGGRCLAMRAKTTQTDITFYSIYFPPEGSAIKISDKLDLWIRRSLCDLPNRTLPVLLLDANAKLGLIRDTANNIHNVVSSAVGNSLPSMENHNGFIFAHHL
jgi:hypothetical protein